MPFTPYHFGPSGFLGLALRRWIDLPMFLLGNVIVDVEVLFAPGWQPHRHWHFHTFLVGGLIGAICGAAVYFAKPLRNLFEHAMRILHVRYTPRLANMVLGGLLGVWMHVVIDGFYHYDVQPFWPMKTNPLYRFTHRPDLRITHDQIETICLAFCALAVILYALAVRSFLKKRNNRAPDLH